jgi:hypothetical protein
MEDIRMVRRYTIFVFTFLMGGIVNACECCFSCFKITVSKPEFAVSVSQPSVVTNNYVVKEQPKHGVTADSQMDAKCQSDEISRKPSLEELFKHAEQSLIEQRQVRAEYRRQSLAQESKSEMKSMELEDITIEERKLREKLGIESSF